MGKGGGKDRGVSGQGEDAERCRTEEGEVATGGTCGYPWQLCQYPEFPTSPLSSCKWSYANKIDHRRPIGVVVPKIREQKFAHHEEISGLPPHWMQH